MIFSLIFWGGIFGLFVIPFVDCLLHPQDRLGEPWRKDRDT